MASNSVTALQYVLKEYYDGQQMVDAALGREDTPFMREITRKDKIAGKQYPLPLQYARGQGMSASLTTAMTNATAIGTKQFLLTMAPVYHVAYWDGETIRSLKGDRGGFVEYSKLVANDAIERMGTYFEFLAFSNGNGALGQISSGYATTTITLTDPAQAYVLEVGMKVEFAATETGALTSSSALTVNAVDTLAGTVTLSAAPSSVSAGASDYLFLEGTAPAGSTVKLPKGLAAWVPYTAPTAGDSHFNMDRSTDVAKLAGQRLDGSSLGHVQAIKKASVLVGRPTGTCWCSPLVWEAISEEMGEQVLRDPGGKGVAGFSDLEVHTAHGKVRVKASRFCPDTRMYLLNMGTWALYSKGPAIDFLDHDGQKVRVHYNSDALESRVGGYSQFGCSDPSRNCVINVTDVD